VNVTLSRRKQAECLNRESQCSLSVLPLDFVDVRNRRHLLTTRPAEFALRTQSFGDVPRGVRADPSDCLDSRPDLLAHDVECNRECLAKEETWTG
jgi:hypothetical protein